MHHPPKQDKTLLIALLVAFGLGGVGMSCICCGGGVWYLGASSTKRVEQMRAENARKLAETRERLGMEPHDPFAADQHWQFAEESRRRHEQMMQEMAEREQQRHEEMRRHVDEAERRQQEWLEQQQEEMRRQVEEAERRHQEWWEQQQQLSPFGTEDGF